MNIIIKTCHNIYVPLPLTWNPKPVTKIGTVVKRSNTETLEKSGSNLSFWVLFPSHNAWIAIAEHMTTKSTASKTDIAEVYFKESARGTCKCNNQLLNSNIQFAYSKSQYILLKHFGSYIWSTIEEKFLTYTFLPD